MYLIRLLITPYLFFYWAQEVEPYQNNRWWASQGIGGLVTGIILIFNDVFMLVIDHLRTDTYLGCVVTQIVINSCLSGYFVPYFMLNARRVILMVAGTSAPYHWTIYYVRPVLLSLEAIFSLCLLVVTIWAIFVLCYHVPLQQVWKINTKDAFAGAISLTAEPCTLSVLGCRRETVVSLGVFIVVKRYLALFLFRRIRPVETRVYAFSRNSFAVIAFGIIFFRIVTAFQQAQNEIGTRVVSRTCDDATPAHRIAVLLDRIFDEPYVRSDISLPDVRVNVSVSIVWPQGRFKGTRNCTALRSQTFRGIVDEDGKYQARILELFKCNPELPYVGINEPQFKQREYSDQIPYYRIQVQPVGGASEGLLDIQMPRIWLLNHYDFLSVDQAGSSWPELGQVRLYLPPLTLLRGFHVVSNANLVTRRFIKSSIIKDIIFSFKSEYKRLSLYPMADTFMTPLNSSDVNAASASIHLALAPGIKSHRGQVNALDLDLNNHQHDECDYIEDYRSSTVIDVIGSVGGLFALLQALHVLLFGRSLLWGLSGAKLIAPFGLLGDCSSRGFKRRLKEGYHVTSGDDGTETIRIVKFLRDFVIDFGPADLDLEQRPAAAAREEISAGP